jgi:hypothetical protein
MNHIILDTDDCTHNIFINDIDPVKIESITIKIKPLQKPKIYINGRKLKGNRAEKILKLKSFITLKYDT